MLTKVSIIVPIYNSEQTLVRCIDSILSQDYRNLEIILVNDGSTDRSLEICENFKKKDNRIIIINKKKEGVSAARNVGLKMASGDYVQFVDSDDYMCVDMTKFLIENINKNKSDLVICGYNRINKNKIIKKLPNVDEFYNIFDFKDCFVYLYKNAFLNVPWNKLYVREKIRTFFNQNLFLGEDLLFNLYYLLSCDKISIENKAIYNYNVSLQKSLAGQYYDNLFYTEVMLYKEVLKFLKNTFGYENFKEINEVFAKEIYYYLKKLVILSTYSKDDKLKKIKECFNNIFVKNMLNNVNLTDRQVKIVCFFMELKCKEAIYLFFKLKKLINKNALR